jgi:hypothetical protein
VNKTLEFLKQHVAGGRTVRIDGNAVTALISQEVEPSIAYWFLLRTDMSGEHAQGYLVRNPRASLSSDITLGYKFGECFVKQNGEICLDGEWSTGKLNDSQFNAETTVTALRRFALALDCFTLYGDDQYLVELAAEMIVLRNSEDSAAA